VGLREGFLSLFSCEGEGKRGKRGERGRNQGNKEGTKGQEEETRRKGGGATPPPLPILKSCTKKK
tara:strand:- start:760 stop:954 length:195 start_codon:yes stop_codon:yes gene_type:complete